MTEGVSAIHSHPIRNGRLKLDVRATQTLHSLRSSYHDRTPTIYYTPDQVLGAMRSEPHVCDPMPQIHSGRKASPTQILAAQGGSDGPDPSSIPES
jgi:hypothetical protein